VHAGERRDETDALEAPLVLSSAFALGTADDAAAAFRGENSRYIYGRWQNPSVEQLEAKVAALEGADAAVATASGMAAVTGALLSSLRAGDHVVAPLACYGETSRLLRERLPELGITTSFVDATRVEEYRAALRPETRVVYLETPANPTLSVTDVAAVAGLAGERGITVIADNTFATPYAQNPLALGVDLVLHSMTKALGGHGDAIGGVVAGADERVARVRDLVVKGFGGVLAPFNAFLIARGMRTLALRQRQACASAGRIAARLEEHPAVSRVWYPGLVASGARRGGPADACVRVARGVRARVAGGGAARARAGRADLARGEPWRCAFTRDAPRLDHGVDHARGAAPPGRYRGRPAAPERGDRGRGRPAFGSGPGTGLKRRAQARRLRPPGR